MMLLEKVQKRFTKGISECKGLKYHQRLIKLGLTTFEQRCHRADLVLTYKIVTGKCDNNLLSMFTVNRNGRTRGNSVKLFKERCRLELRRHSFSNRVVDMWNKLPYSIVSVDSVELFKTKLGQLQSECGGSR